jgi:hypothetical protein
MHIRLGALIMLVTLDWRLFLKDIDIIIALDLDEVMAAEMA